MVEDYLDQAAWIEAHLDDWTGPGSGGSERSSRGGHSDPTAAAAIAPGNETTDLVAKQTAFYAKVIALEDDLVDLKGPYAEVKPLTLEQARTTKQPDKRPGVGACAVDGEWVTGVDPDRLRAGYCPRHYQQWVREDRPDRAEFEARVRTEPTSRAG